MATWLVILLVIIALVLIWPAVAVSKLLFILVALLILFALFSAFGGGTRAP